MKQTKKIILNNNEIDLNELIRQLWKQKIIILFTCLFFLAAGYLYGTLQPKIYKTVITLRLADPSSFKNYDILLKRQQGQGFFMEFNEEVKLKLLSLDTLIQFVENNNKISNFKNHLKEKDISFKEYFNEKFQPIVDKKNIPNRYSLTYSQPLPGKTFLNDYIFFVQKQALITLKEQLEKQIIAEILLYNRQLRIAESVKIESPILKSAGESSAVLNDFNSLFYKGSIVLSQEIFNLNEILNKTKDITLDYNPILEQASDSVLISKSPKIFAFIAFFLGLFLSSIIILIRNIKK